MAKEHFDVILTDMRMPDLDGHALYRAIEERWPGRAARVFGQLPSLCASEPDAAFLIRVGAGRWIANGTVLR